MTTLVPTTDTLAITTAELVKRFNVHLDECDRRLEERFARQQASVDRTIATQQASLALAAEALKQVAATANSQMVLFDLRMSSVYSRLVTTIVVLSISFFVLGAFSFVHALTAH